MEDNNYLTSSCGGDIRQSEEYKDLWESYLEKSAEVTRLEDELEEFSENSNSIFDLDDFKYRLREDGLLTSKLEDFIDYYMKYRNKDNITF